jgi:hypothetical protein
MLESIAAKSRDIPIIVWCGLLIDIERGGWMGISKMNIAHNITTVHLQQMIVVSRIFPRVQKSRVRI